jgi:hypothetical protein
MNVGLLKLKTIMVRYDELVLIARILSNVDQDEDCEPIVGFDWEFLVPGMD